MTALSTQEYNNWLDSTFGTAQGGRASYLNSNPSAMSRAQSFLSGFENASSFGGSYNAPQPSQAPQSSSGFNTPTDQFGRIIQPSSSSEGAKPGAQQATQQTAAPAIAQAPPYQPVVSNQPATSGQSMPLTQQASTALPAAATGASQVASTQQAPAQPNHYDPKNALEQAYLAAGYPGATQGFGGGQAVQWASDPSHMSALNNILTQGGMNAQSAQAATPQAFTSALQGAQSPDYLTQLTQLLTSAGLMGGAAPPSHTQPMALALPSDLSGLSGLDPRQQRSAIATMGTQGAGASQNAKAYYLNLLQRNLVNGQNNVQDISSINLLPVEQSYLQSMGLPYGSSQDFLQALNSSGTPSSNTGLDQLLSLLMH